MATPSYALALYISLPIVVCLLLLLAGVLFLCCSRRYRINWYERSLLESSVRDQESEKAFLQPTKRTRDKTKGLIKGISNSTSRRDLDDNNLPPVTIGHGSTTVITKKVKPQFLDTGSMGSSSSSPSSDHSPISSLSEALADKRVSFSSVLPSAYTNGGSGTPSTGGGVTGRRDTIHGIVGSRRDSSTLSTGSGEARRDSAEFWVPPAVMQRKRAQSLVPTLGLFQQQTDDSGKYKIWPCISSIVYILFCITCTLETYVLLIQIFRVKNHFKSCKIGGIVFITKFLFRLTLPTPPQPTPPK